MFSKQNFSNDINLFEENIQNKILNTCLYTKSFVRTKDSSNKRIESTIDDNFILSSLLKGKIKKFKNLKENRSDHRIKFSSKRNLAVSTEGTASTTQTSLYKNRKNDGFKFHSSVSRSSSCRNQIDLLRQSIEGLKRSNSSNKSSLLILMPKRGGFLCHASGVLGYLPRKHGNNLFCAILSFLLKDKKLQTRLKNVLFITDRQIIDNNLFLLRLRCFLGKFRFIFRKKRKKFSLSRKKKGKKTAYRRYTMIFISNFDN
jgi:hypothetical protein